MGWPVTTTRNPRGELVVGGVSAVTLADRFGTPLYLFDEATLRERARTLRRAFATHYPKSRVVYAGKAYLSPALVAILGEEGIGLDVVSGGELYAGLRAGVPAGDITLHGNNKDERELRDAVAAGVGLIALDNDDEIDLLASILAESDLKANVLLRLNPGIAPVTHHKMRTGALDSKPELVVEPGRALVGPSGVALYRVGARKRIPGVRTYVSVDGGMADNIRPSLYGARYTAVLAGRDVEGPAEVVTIAGKYCESGDVLIEEVALPELRPGDLLAVPMAGAYCLAMASNYNLAPRPAAVLVREGRVALFRERERVEDLLRCERDSGQLSWEDAG